MVRNSAIVIHRQGMVSHEEEYSAPDKPATRVLPTRARSIGLNYAIKPPQIRADSNGGRLGAARRGNLARREDLPLGSTVEVVLVFQLIVLSVLTFPGEGDVAGIHGVDIGDVDCGEDKNGEALRATKAGRTVIRDLDA